MAIRDLVFSDLFVSDSAATSWFKATPDSMSIAPIPPDCETEVGNLRKALLERDCASFRIEWPDENGMRLRVQRMNVIGSQPVFVCRRFSLVPGSLPEMGVPPPIAEQMMVNDLKDGLVVFFGKAGAGKSTTAASFMLSRLAKFGGVAWTVESPAEMLLAGRHGKGWCYQTEASSDDDIGPAIKDLMRATPNIIFIGELRTAESVRQALTAATSGHLVVATFHAYSLQAGIARLARIAGDEQGADLVADCLKLGMHLSLHDERSGNSLPNTLQSQALPKGTGNPPRILQTNGLWVIGQNAEIIRGSIRRKMFSELNSEIERQRRLMMNNQPI
jgi:hypothetical protein